jgi:hypothetical protein
VRQTLVALLGEALLPAPDAGLRLAGPAHESRWSRDLPRCRGRFEPARRASAPCCGPARAPPDGGAQRAKS